MKYRKGYKYQVEDRFFVSIASLGIRGRFHITSKGGFIEIEDGFLIIEKGYAWDGPSGPTFDTMSAMRGSCVHDALYQLMREGLLPMKPTRRRADLLFWELIRKDGMGRIRASYFFLAVFFCGRKAASPASTREVYDTDKQKESAAWPN